MAKKTNPIVNDETEKQVVKEPVSDVVDIDFKETKRKKFRIDGDNNKILELNTSDLTVLNRIEESYPRLVALGNKASRIQVESEPSEDSELDMVNEMSNITSTLKEIDTEMREIVDYIFDSNVSELCASEGSMFDPFNGDFRYEHIIDKLTKLYESNLNNEFGLVKKKIQKHTDKYTGQKR